MSLVLFAFSRLFMAACGSFNPQNSWCLNRVSYDRRQRSFNMTKLSTTWLKSDVAACWCSVWRAFAGTRSVTILVNVCRFEASWWLWIFRDLFSCIVCIQIWYIVYTHLLFSEIPKKIPHILTKKSLQKRFFFPGLWHLSHEFSQGPWPWKMRLVLSVWSSVLGWLDCVKPGRWRGWKYSGHQPLCGFTSNLKVEWMLHGFFEN